MCGARTRASGMSTPDPRKPSARRAVSMASRSTIAGRPHCAIISMPMAAISMEMK